MPPTLQKLLKFLAVGLPAFLIAIPLNFSACILFDIKSEASRSMSVGFSAASPFFLTAHAPYV